MTLVIDRITSKPIKVQIQLTSTDDKEAFCAEAYTLNPQIVIREQGTGKGISARLLKYGGGRKKSNVQELSSVDTSSGVPAQDNFHGRSQTYPIESAQESFRGKNQGYPKRINATF